MSIFISLEGGEGSGKTSVIKEIIKDLENNNFNDILATREPGGIKISEQIREVLLDKKNVEMDKKTEALLFAAARRQHLVEKIIPALKRKKSIVICDRFIDSSLVYQGMARNIGFDNVFNINQFAIEGHIPHITFFLDLEPEIGLKRISSNKDREVNRIDLEELNFHKKIRKGYLFLAKKFPDRIKVIDGDRSIKEISDEILIYILDYWENHIDG